MKGGTLFPMTTETELVELRLAHQQEMLRLAAQGILWAIVDACNEPVVLEKVQEIGEGRASCLFRGEAQQEDRDDRHAAGDKRYEWHHGAADDVVDLPKHRIAEIRAVPLKKPLVGPIYVRLEKVAGQPVLAH